MKQLFILLALTLVACKKDNPEPEPAPAPPPITSANTTFYYMDKYGGSLRIVAGELDTVLTSVNISDTAKLNAVINQKTVSATVTFFDKLISANGYTLIVNSGYKSYNIVDKSTSPRLIYLW